MKEKKIIANQIVIDTSSYSVEMKANRQVRPRADKDSYETYIKFIGSQTIIKQLITTMCKEKKYPEVLQKLIDFRKEFSPEGAADNAKELKDFFKVIRRVRILFNKNFYVETVIRMLSCATISPGSLAKDPFNEKFLAAFVDKDVRQKFWGTKNLLTLLLVKRLLEDLKDGVDMKKFTIKNLRKSSLVIYFLDNYTLKDFTAFCNSKA